MSFRYLNGTYRPVRPGRGTRWCRPCRSSRRRAAPRRRWCGCTPRRRRRPTRRAAGRAARRCSGRTCTDARRLQRALEQRRGLVEQVVDLGPGHRPDRRRVAERQDLEHLAVGQEHRVVRPQALGRAVGRVAAPDVGAGSGRILLVAPVDPDAAGVVEEHVDVVGGGRVRVEGAVDRVVDEVPHHAVAVVVAQQVDLAVADRLVDQGEVARIGRVAGDERLDRRVLRVGGADHEARPGHADAAVGAARDVRAAPPCGPRSGPGRRPCCPRDGGRHVGVAVAADDQAGGLAGVVELLGQGLVAVDREPIAVAAVGEAVVLRTTMTSDAASTAS